MEKSIGELLGAFPFNYAGPLWEALLRSPAHYIIEAVLLLIIAYIVLFKKTYDPSKRCAALHSALLGGSFWRSSFSPAGGDDARDERKRDRRWRRATGRRGVGDCVKER